MKPTISAISPWFGSNRMLGENVGKLMGKRAWVGVPMCGGMCELPHIDARTVLVSDKHRHVINLARIIQRSPQELIAALDALPFHPDVLHVAQAECILKESDSEPVSTMADPAYEFQWAVDFFVSSWMARSGIAGTDAEFNGGIATRWNAGGGDSAVRFRNATEAIAEWSKAMRRCTFVCQDVFEFLENVKDEAGHGVYADPPWVEDGAKYAHKFTESDHRRLAARLSEFQCCRVVVRYGDHELIRELYPESSAGWSWRRQKSRTSANKAKAEVLIVRG